MGEIRIMYCPVGALAPDGHPAGEGLLVHWCGLPDHHDGRDHQCAKCGVWFRPTVWERVLSAVRTVYDFLGLQWTYVLRRTVCRWFSHDLHAGRWGATSWTECRRCGLWETEATR